MFKAVRLLTEYKDSPIGMDEPFPRFSYRLEGSSFHQSAYRIVVSDEERKRTVWDSGKVESGESIQIAGKGMPLKPHTGYVWTVRVWDENDRVSPESSSRFETGFLGRNWTAKWIGDEEHSENRRPVNIFRNVFAARKTVVSARLYLTALGLYKAALNGKTVSDDCFTPGWTQYHERVQYQAYDVTNLIRPGERNVLSIRVAEGWYAGRIARREMGRPSYGDQPLLKAELHLRHADGAVSKLVTDGSWEVRPGEIRMSDIYDGEHMCAYLADPEWEFSAPVNPNAKVFRKNVRIEWQTGAGVKRMHELEPVSITKRPNGAYLVDFGKNFAGRERFTLKGASRGDVITIRHGEMLYPDGALYTENLRSALARTVYEANDAPVQTYEPEFTFYGFRYLEICGWPGELTKDSIRAAVLYSDLAETGKFHCSNDLLNRLHSNILRSQQSNFLDVPTDCPQRDERIGWTGDAQVFANVASYNMDTSQFYRKWIRDLNFSRSPDGAYPIIAPVQYRNWTEKGACTGWSDAGLICPWQMYRKYGDTDILEEYLSNMEQFLDLQTGQAGAPLVDNARFGDWLNLQAPTSGKLLSSTYLVGMNRLLARMARVLNRAPLAEKRERIADEIAQACRKEFLTEKGELKEKTQTAALLFLHFGIGETAERKKIFDFLVQDIFETRGGHLSTGFLGTPLLAGVLSDNGRPDLAYRLLEQTSYPGWLYPVTLGATTIWEHWNGWTPENGFVSRDMNSFNHYACGAVGEWFYETICGIQPIPDDVSARGFKRFRLAPVPGGSLTSASAEYDSMYGKIISAWEISGKTLSWNFTVPRNTEAEIVFPVSKKIPSVPGIRKKKGKHIARPGNYAVTLSLS